MTGSLILPLVGLIAYLERRGRASGKLGRIAIAENRTEADGEEPEAGIEALHVPDKNMLR